MRHYAGGLMTEPRLRDRTLDESILPDGVAFTVPRWIVGFIRPWPQIEEITLPGTVTELQATPK
jgi:hypothetical protein